MLMYDIVQYMIGKLPISVKTMVRMHLPHDCCLFSVGEYSHPRTARWLVIICLDIPPDFAVQWCFNRAIGSRAAQNSRRIFRNVTRPSRIFGTQSDFLILAKSEQQRDVLDIVAWSSLRIRMHTSILESFFLEW